jgi:cytochrome P450/NADPH-cytochrome P450 reductase
MTIVYGSNTGTCQALAQKLSVEARKHGYSADVKEMNAAVDGLPKGQPSVIITASYEGEPPDNADQFVAWLETMTANSTLEGVEYAVFGCGHSDWKNTFHRIPTLVDDLLEKRGGKRLAPRGLTDAAKGDIYTDFDTWSDQVFWPSFAPDSSSSQALSASLEVEMSTQNRSSYLRQDVQMGSVTDSKKLTADGQPEKRHLEIKLPDGMTYETGDYLAILPLNPQENIARAMKHFRIPQDATINIKPGSATFLPTGVSISVVDLLRGFVELSLPVTKKDLQACLSATKDPVEKVKLSVFNENERFSEMVEQRLSLLDLCCKYPSIELPFSTFVSMLPPLRPRHYSISSSPLHDPAKCTVTYGVIDGDAKSGIGRYVGVTSTYLAALKPGDEILVSVRATNKFFHLPADLDVPILMIGAGSGIAPFRGFIQERAIQIKAGRKVGPTLMFMGCRSEADDRLYADEIDSWVKMGALDVRYSFSKEPEKSEGCKYVQDRMVKDKEDVLRLWGDGAKLFLCGAPEVSSGVGEVAKLLLLESHQEKGQELTEEQVSDWFRARRNERFVVDVFA